MTPDGGFNIPTRWNLSPLLRDDQDFLLDAKDSETASVLVVFLSLRPRAMEVLQTGDKTIDERRIILGSIGTNTITTVWSCLKMTVRCQHSTCFRPSRL